MKWPAALILPLFLCLSINAQTVGNLTDVKIIYVGKITGSDRAERFRSLVGKELSDRGFIVTESENAETSLNGVLTVTAQQKTSGVSTGGVITVTPGEPRLSCECKVILRNGDGRILWQWEGSAGSTRFWQTMELEPIANLALKLALALEKAYKKALKKKTGDRKQKTEFRGQNSEWRVHMRAEVC
jgi:hypothetical protein